MANKAKELATKVSDALDGSEELDAEIVACLNNATVGNEHKFPVLPLTRSIDAAMSLVRGRLSMLSHVHQPDMGGKQWHASIHDAGHFRARARTPALAIVACALQVIAKNEADT